MKGSRRSRGQREHRREREKQKQKRKHRKQQVLVVERYVQKMTCASGRRAGCARFAALQRPGARARVRSLGRQSRVSAALAYSIAPGPPRPRRPRRSCTSRSSSRGSPTARARKAGTPTTRSIRLRNWGGTPGARRSIRLGDEGFLRRSKPERRASRRSPSRRSGEDETQRRKVDRRAPQVGEAPVS